MVNCSFKAEIIVLEMRYDAMMRIKLTNITNSCVDWLIIGLSVKFLRDSSERDRTLGLLLV